MTVLTAAKEFILYFICYFKAGFSCKQVCHLIDMFVTTLTAAREFLLFFICSFKADFSCKQVCHLINMVAI